MRYALLLHYPEMNAEELGPEALAEGMREFDEYAKALDAAGVLRSAEVLQPSSATTTVRGGDTLRIQDGPYADTKEQLGRHVRDRRRRPRRGDRLGRSSPLGQVGRRRDPSRRHPVRRRSLDAIRLRMTAAPRADAVGARAAAERAARASYGRILAVIAAATRDVALAEDALADAFEKALRTWPDAGIPDNPEGWLVTVARNRLRDLLRSPAVRDAAPLLESVLDADDRDAAAILAGREQIPDKRLELLFACAHPAIDPGIRTPLMLQVVLGFDAAQIARAFAVEPADDGAAARPGEAADPRCRHPVRRSDPPRHAGAAERRARGDLRRVRDRLARLGRG